MPHNIALLLGSWICPEGFEAQRLI